MKERKKIGIITLYNNNNNYGGVAQAYALNEYFKKMGYESELINYCQTNKKINYAIKPQKNIKYYTKKIKNKIKKELLKPVFNKYEKKYFNELKARADKLESFRNTMEHSEIYDSTSINKIEKKYDYFVTGSDQCWNPGVIDEAYTFSFLDGKNKNIFSYASSVAVSQVSDEYKKFMSQELKKYSYISVREEKSKELLQECTEKNIEWVVDPTLLLEREEWKHITGKRIIKEKYIFSYMLGEGKEQRHLVEKFAKQKGMKLVTIPFIVNGNKFSFKYEDRCFGDIQELDLSFYDFLSLIANSEYVLTDSFHAVCFSYIFKKEFYVFERNSGLSTSSRVYSLLKLLGINEKRIWNKEIIEDDNIIDYDKASNKIKKNIEASKAYIKKALNKNN